LSSLFFSNTSTLYKPIVSIEFTRSNPAHWPDTSGQNLKVEVWGKMPIQIEDPPTRLDEVERQPED
jgi:hypothetical protein